MSEDFFARRAIARARLDAIDPHMTAEGAAADPLRKQWFEAAYRLAEGDPAGVPWAQLAPHRLLADWLAGLGTLSGVSVLDVGCGLGDNAEAFAAARADVTAFDLIEAAVAWARRRFPESRVDYRAADLFDAPRDWRGAFDIVHECYTLQALPDTLLARAAHALASFVRPGGALLVIARAREEDEAAFGPPWRLTRRSVEALAVDGLRLETLEDISATTDMARHWRAAFRRDA